MSYTAYDDSILVAQDALKSLHHILKVGSQHPNAANLPSARLHADMLPLTFQVESATNTAAKLPAKLLGQPAPSFVDGKLTTWEDMFARIEAAQEVLAEVDGNDINRRGGEKIILGVDKEGNRAPFPTPALVFGYSLPNIFFHVTTAYGILRKEGVPLGKSDYLDSFGERFS
jgi:hypothetical protein